MCFGIYCLCTRSLRIVYSDASAVRILVEIAHLVGHPAQRPRAQPRKVGTYVILYYTVLYRSILYSPILHYTILHDMGLVTGSRAPVQTDDASRGSLILRNPTPLSNTYWMLQFCIQTSETQTIQETGFLFS